MRPGKSQKEGQEDQGTLKALGGGSPLALLPLTAPPSLASGFSLARQPRNIHLELALGPFKRESRQGIPLKGAQGQFEVYISGLPTGLAASSNWRLGRDHPGYYCLSLGPLGPPGLPDLYEPFRFV